MAEGLGTNLQQSGGYHTDRLVGTSALRGAPACPIVCKLSTCMHVTHDLQSFRHRTPPQHCTPFCTTAMQLQVHGLMVSSQVSEPMKKICTHTHVFRSWTAVGGKEYEYA